MEINAASGIACQRCGEANHDLRFAKFRWVLGLLVLDRIYYRAGYYCNSCVRREFLRSQALTLIFGWWGMLAMIFRNPYSLAANTKALFKSPIFADNFGAITMNVERDGITPLRD